MTQTKTEKFIAKAKDIHGNKYDYSKIEYVNSKTKVIITCPTHGDFLQTAKDHVSSKAGCSKCAAIVRNKDTRLTPESFLNKAREVHGNKYDYSKVNFENSHSNIDIICPDHGPWVQKVYSHLQGHGCPKCSSQLHAFTQEDFVKEAKKIHGDKYDYSQTIYTGTRNKVKIICPIHGDFEQKAGTHLASAGCPNCFSRALLGTEEFIKRAKEIHGDKYDYSKTEYKKIHDKVIITCPIHGDFSQVANSHISNEAGCPKCANIATSIRLSDTLEEFIAKAKEIHGDKYDYSKTEYKGSGRRLEITCPKHGDFSQAPSVHLVSKIGCPKCAKESTSAKLKTSLEEFIAKAREIHGDRYDYSKVNYINTKTKVNIICSIHGDFWQSPSSHLSGGGCDKCGGSADVTKEEFIARSKEVHGNKYDYSEVEYVNSSVKVKIICPIHGPFFQSPEKHYTGQGCKKCAFNKLSTLYSLTEEEFIKRAKAIHGDRYDYSKVVYVNGRTKVIIICPIHGEFLQEPANHLNGSKCPYCQGKHIHTTQEFIELANIVHNNFYNYSKFKYLNIKTKGVINCPKHGDFLQNPNNHLSNKAGCPVCKASKGELAIRHILNKSRILQIPQYRIPKLINRFYYDFYLPEYNVLIEFHGGQHYIYIPFFHRNGEDDLLAQKNRDDLKKHFAKEFKYNYLEFNYKQLKELGTEKFQELVLTSIYKFKKKT